MTCLNPTKTIKKQITEVMQDAKDKEARAEQLLYKVGISDPKQKLLCYPHELSGGTLQRIVIAISLVNNPQILLADEPTTALDVTIQAQVLELLQKLKQEFSMSMILVTHDLAVVAKVADRVAIMYGERS